MPVPGRKRMAGRWGVSGGAAGQVPGLVVMGVVVERLGRLGACHWSSVTREERREGGMPSAVPQISALVASTHGRVRCGTESVGP